MASQWRERDEEVVSRDTVGLVLGEVIKFTKVHCDNSDDIPPLQESDIRTKGESLLSPGVLSAVTKSLAKRVPSLSPSALSTPEKTNASSVSGVDAESLEDSMKRVGPSYKTQFNVLLFIAAGVNLKCVRMSS